MNAVKQITRLINTCVFVKVCICFFESCYDTADIFIDCIVDILSAFDLTSSDLQLFVFVLRTVTRFAKLSEMLEQFPNMYKHGPEIYYYCLHRMCMYRSTYVTENCGNSRCLQSQELCFSLQHGHHSNPAAPNLQHTTNREQNDRCGNSTAQSQAPDDGYIDVQNMLST